jgi:NAD(P)-dependent dehydrogenase (short-subunit alcohol dehydrogenase family)
MRNLAGKTAFITGGASGIGLGMARAFLRDGMNVVIGDFSEANLADAKARLAGEPVAFVQVDVADRAAVGAIAPEVVNAFGALDVLCNNAGISGAAAVADPGFADWDRVMSVNLGGVVNVTKTFVPIIRANGNGGHIVNTSSMAGILALPMDGGAYSTAKFAVRGLSESLRMSLAPEGIGVSLLCPGLTRTRIQVSRPERLDEGGDPMAKADDLDGLFKTMDGGMDPDEVGVAVVRGIRENLAYILSHGEFHEEVSIQFDEILTAFPIDQAVPEARAALERGRRGMCDSLRYLPVID